MEFLESAVLLGEWDFECGTKVIMFAMGAKRTSEPFMSTRLIPCITQYVANIRLGEKGLIMLKIFQIFTLVLTLASVSSQVKAVSQADIDFAKQKYQIAEAINKMADKCKYSESDLLAAGMNNVLRATAVVSAEGYRDFLNTNGQSAFVTSMDAQITTATKNSLCSRYKADPNVQSFIQSGSLLINEMLYAISLSGVNECGDVTNLIAPVIAEAKRIAPSMSVRTDLSSLKPLAESNADEFKEMCSDENMFGGDYLFMAQKPFGELVIEMAKFMKK